MAKPITFKFLGDASSLNKSLTTVESRLGRLGKAGAVAGAALAAGIAGGLVSVGNDFKEATNTIIAGTGATGEALEGLTDSFKNVVSTVPTDFATASTAIADINTALGLTGEELEEFSGQLIDLSRVAKEDIGTTVAAQTRVLGDWGIATEDANAAMDKLWTISQATGIGVNDLSDKMVAAGAPLRQLGFSFEEGAAIFGKWQKEGVNTEAIMAGLKSGIGKLASQGKDIPEAFDEITRSIQEAGSMSEATAIAVEAFGTRAGGDMAAAVREGRFEIDDLVQSLEGSRGAIMATADDTESLGEKWQLVKNNVFVAIEPIASKMFDAILNGMDKLLPKVKELLPRFEDFGRTAFNLGQTYLPKVVNAVKNVVSTGQELIDWLKENDELVIGLGVAIATGLVVAFGAWAASAGAAALATAAAAAPVVALGVVIAGATALVVKWYRENDTFKAKIDAIGRFFRDTLLPNLQAFGEWVWNVGIPAVKDFAFWIGEKLIAGGKAANDAYNDFKRGLDKIKNYASAFKSGAAAAFNSIKDTILAPFKSAFGWIEEQWYRLQRLMGITGNKSGGTISKLQTNVNSASFARFTGGPIARDGFFDVGEKGRERVFLPRGSRVEPAHKTASDSGGIVINVNSQADAMEIGREVGWALAIRG